MKIKCPGCSSILQIPPAAAGKVVKCKCGKQLRAPNANPAATQPQTAPQTAPQPAPQQPTPQQPAAPQAGAAAGQPFPAGQGAQRISMNTAAAAPAAAAPSGPSIFDELTETDLSGVKAVRIPGTDAKPKTSAAGKKALQSAASEHQQERDQSHKEYMQGARKEIMTSIGILLSLGLIRVILNLLLFIHAPREVQEMALGTGLTQEELEGLLLVIRIVYATKLFIGMLFLLAAATFFLLPMTSAITALVVFILGEIMSLITYPILLVSIRGWIWRCAIFGALLQAINNASYYKLVKSGGRAGD